MKKRLLMRLATLCLCVGLVGGSALAAGKMYKNITVQYDNIKLVIDGVTITHDVFYQKLIEKVYEQTDEYPQYPERSDL